MTLAIQDLSTLDASVVAQTQQQLAQLLAEKAANVDTSRGVVHDLLLYLASLLVTAEAVNVDLLRQSQSLLAISENPALADDTTVDALLSNFNVTRQVGEPATGMVTILLTAAVPVVVPDGVTFTANAASFTTDRAFPVRTSVANVTGPDDRVLTPLGDGRYAFTIPVTATSTGVAGMLRRGTSVIPQFSLPNFSQAYVEADFSGGFDTETNADLLARLQRGVAAKAWSNRTNIDAMIHAQPAFSRALQVSTIGCGDAEMLRDKHSILPLALGGRCDVYCRTATLPQDITVTVTAALIAKGAAGGTWQFNLTKDIAPGFYEVSRVALLTMPQSNAGFEVTSDARGVDMTGATWLPDIVNALEAVYSRYQVAVIQFLDNKTPADTLTIGTTAKYSVSLRTMPQIDTLQAFLGGRDVRNPAGDVLVKAPIPCFLSLAMEVRKRPQATSPDIAAMTKALSDHVNSLGFAGRLDSSDLVGVVRDLLPEGCFLGPIDMFGRIRKPNGSIAFLRDKFSMTIRIPDDAVNMTTPRTTVFILDPTSVAIAIVGVDVPEI